MTGESRRRRPVYLTDERALLEAWLEFHRATLLVKCDGLTADQLRERPLDTSPMSLHGLLRHLTETERNWFSRILPDCPEIPPIWSTAESERVSMVVPPGAVWDEDLATWRDECETSRAVAASFSLDHAGKWREKDVTLRSIYHHMIQEYARHNGHADLFREMIDGVVGL